MKKQFAEEYGTLEQWHWWFRGRQRILESALARAIGGRTGLSIASVGCGPIEGLGWLKPFAGPGGRVVGIDAEPLHARGSMPGVQYVIGKLEEAPISSGAFDVLLALDVLEHLDDDATGLAEATRMLKPGGLLIVTVPALPSLWGGQDVVSHHRRRYTRRTLLDVFTRNHLPHPETSYFNTLLFPPIAAVRWTRAALGQANRPQSDFEGSPTGFVNDMLASVFAFERHLVGRVPMPVGVSLLATTRVPER